MGYYIRILTKNLEYVPLSEIGNGLRDKKYDVVVESDDEAGESWEQITLLHPDETPICVIERNDVTPDSLGQAELEEFSEDIPLYKPQSAVNWLKDYLQDIRVIYAIELFSGIDEGDGWGIVGFLKEVIWNKLGGILQGDLEGFSNEDGYHNLWQFNNSVTGPWHMAVLDASGEWVKFTLDLGDKSQREEFLSGIVPKKAIIEK